MKSVWRIYVAVLGCATAVAVAAGGERPNVILVMTDDQGYGDIAAHGHPYLRTPHMDRLRAMSVRLDRFHVDPTCSPTRAALMTGRYSGRVGVWHTVMGRNILRADETTLAEVFRAAGYRTAIYGKWHLGDNYPYGARFRGFDDAIVHFGGGVGQTPDYWGNDYFEDHYNENGSWRPFQGYCTDVWFREALRFIHEHRDRPFFVYLPTNAAHQTRPHVPERYRALYDDVDAPDHLKVFWGMISNLDDNLGVLLDRLDHWGLIENTVLIFMGDNGTTMGPHAWPADQREDWADRFNAGMRGAKGSHYDGGHRVFCYVHYPAAGIAGGRDVQPITAHIDLVPTLLDLCGIQPPSDVRFDGQSLVPLLQGDGDNWPDRILFLHNQRVLDPVKWRNTSVMTDRWRLISGVELYDIQHDPGQWDNVIGDHLQVVAELTRAYDRWWDEISPRFNEGTPLYVGAQPQCRVQLTAHDWMLDDLALLPWNQPVVQQRPVSNGPWQVRVARAGRYAFVLRERPASAAFPLTASTARLRIDPGIDVTKPVPSGASGVRFEVVLCLGDAEIKTWLIDADDTTRGAYYLEVEFLGD